MSGKARETLVSLRVQGRALRELAAITQHYKINSTADFKSPESFPLQLRSQTQMENCIARAVVATPAEAVAIFTSTDDIMTGNSYLQRGKRDEVFNRS